MNTKSKTKLNHVNAYPAFMSENQLPTRKEVLLHFYKHKENFPQNKEFNQLKGPIVETMLKIYRKVPQATISQKRIEIKLKELIGEYNGVKKLLQNSVKVQSFIEKSSELFDISACKCKMEAKFAHGKMICSCPSENKILEHEYNFIWDQRNSRPRVMYISHTIDQHLTSRYNLTQERRDNYLKYEKPKPTKKMDDSSTVPTLNRTRGLKRSYVDDIEDENLYRWKGPVDIDPEYNIADKHESIKLMDAAQAHTSDKKGVSNRALSEILINDSNKVNKSLSTNTTVKGASKSGVYKHRVKVRNEQIRKVDEELKSQIGPLQLMFDGKKINGRERMVVILQYIDENGVMQERFAQLKSFEEEESITGERLFDAIVVELFDDELLKKVYSILSDTTAVNTGSVKGINSRVKAYFNKEKGRDMHVFECLLHINELFLNHLIKVYEGDSKAPNKMEKGSVYNLIDSIDPEDLKPNKLKRDMQCISVNEQAKKILDHGLSLASVWKEEKTQSVLRGDHLRLLTLTCNIYRPLPENLQQYVFHRQETLSQARWCTTASGYLRVYSFDLFQLTKDQTSNLIKIIDFIVNVYVPSFVQINLHPSVPSGPENVLVIRDLMKANVVPEKVKQIFLDHAEKWLSPINAAVVVHKEAPPVSVDDLKKIRKLSVKTRQLCWSKNKIQSFLTVESACAPCLSYGTSAYWRAIDNHNRTCERYIGKIGLVFKHG